MSGGGSDALLTSRKEATKPGAGRMLFECGLCRVYSQDSLVSSEEREPQSRQHRHSTWLPKSTRVFSAE
jgi:hypothetical protein